MLWNHSEFVALMIAVGAELNLTNRFDVTLLTHAKNKGYSKISKTLSKTAFSDVIFFTPY